MYEENQESSNGIQHAPPAGFRGKNGRNPQGLRLRTGHNDARTRTCLFDDVSGLVRLTHQAKSPADAGPRVQIHL